MNPEKVRVLQEAIGAEITRTNSYVAHYRKELKQVEGSAEHHINTAMGTLRETRVRSVRAIINILLEELEHLNHQQLVHGKKAETDERGGGDCA